jgi:hypothetical protein
VPVILSDQWAEPSGPDWERFSIRVRERDFREIPQLLERRESEAVRMGQLARTQWEQWFSDHAAFHRVVEWCLLIRARRRLPETLARLPAYLQLLRPFHLRYALRTPYRAAREAFRKTTQAASEPHSPVAARAAAERPQVL